MQMMARSSTEGELPGLGWLDAEVKRLDDSAARARACLPHMGWNDVSARAHPLFAGLEEPCFYFLHSYYIQPVDEECTLATVDFHGTFPCAVVKKNILGVQFHPEKSHSWGIRLLRNFALL
jgi:glutamine amidotransferase